MLYRHNNGLVEVVENSTSSKNIKVICIPGLMPVEQVFSSEEEMPKLFLEIALKVRKISGGQDFMDVKMYSPEKKLENIKNFFSRMNINLGKHGAKNLLYLKETEQYIYLYDDVESEINSFERFKSNYRHYSETTKNYAEKIFHNLIHSECGDVMNFSEIEENFKKIRFYGISLGSHTIIEFENYLREKLIQVSFTEAQTEGLLSNIFALGVANVSPRLSFLAKNKSDVDTMHGFTKYYFENHEDVAFAVKNQTNPYKAEFEGDFKFSQLSKNTLGLA